MHGQQNIDYAAGTFARPCLPQYSKSCIIVEFIDIDTDIDINIFVNSNLVGTRWQYTFTRNT
jgi:hypothetical protein